MQFDFVVNVGLDKKVMRRLVRRHAVGELLKCLTEEGDGDPGVSIKCELHSVLNLRFPAIFHQWIRVIFVPETCSQNL